MPDPAAVRARLLGAGARVEFRGMMVDRRYDRDGELLAKDHVVRLREYRSEDGSSEFRFSWKGPTGVTSQGYKSRRELEFSLRPMTPSASAEDLLAALGFELFQQIDRWVEISGLASAVVRLEWYPRMDVLVEVEGDEAGIEHALRVIGLPRSAYSAEALPAFAARFGSRTGTPAALSLAELGTGVPTWEHR
ncbi:MAG: hypothetical protein ACT4PM_12920 [Gemmatimonadales bacterium]